MVSVMQMQIVMRFQKEESDHIKGVYVNIC